MPIIASPKSVELFLREFRERVQEQGWAFHRRCDIDRDLGQYGISRKEAQFILTCLSVRDFSSGPEPEENGEPGKVWIFGYPFDGKEIYIKFYIDDEKAYCFSFHVAKYPLGHPYDSEE